MHRRALLSTFGVAALAGCQRLGFGEETLSFRTVEVGNRSAEPRSLTLRIEADGDPVHESTHDLEAGDPYAAERVDRDWPVEADAYTLRVESDVEDGEVVRVFDEPLGGRCVDLIVQVSRAERVEVFRGTSGECR